MSREAGKGSASRKQRDDDKFRENWEKIFGSKKSEPCFCENQGKCAHPFCSCGSTKASPPDSIP